MRDVTFTVIMALGIVALCLCIAQTIMDIQKPDTQLHNPYWPFSVETSIKDK